MNWDIKNMTKLRIITFCIIHFLLLSGTLSAQSISIANISASRGYYNSIVEISGSGFSNAAGDLVVWFGASTGTIVSATDNLIICKVPAGTSTSAITVLNKTSGLSASSSTIFHEIFKGATSPDLTALDNYNFSNTQELFDLVIVDLDKDGKLSKGEYNDFVHPNEKPHMRETKVDVSGVCALPKKRRKFCLAI